MSKTPTKYVIVDKITGKLDWDGDLHPSIESCIESLCGPQQPYAREEEENEAELTVWSEIYEIRRVLSLGNRPVQYRVTAA
jgi:hypothetical protein